MRNKILVGRVSRSGHHYYSILCDDSGFEFIFRSGHDRWSTISPSFAKKILLKHNRKKLWPFNKAKEFLRIASEGILANQNDLNGWQISRPIKYSSRDKAINEERSLLDKSWEEVEKENEIE